ncbi:MAG: SUMF1/EgtB/PvdO family nonheme iron enzyme [Planctomycetota bacterium]
MKRTLMSKLLFAMSAAFLAATTFAEVPGISDSKPAEGPSVELENGKFMVPYEQRIPGTDMVIEMLPIPGGTFMMGSPEDSDDHQEDEGPQFEVSADPMWVAKTEITWAQYKQYMNLYSVFKEFEANGVRTVDETNKVDAITAPTELYEPTYTYEYGERDEQAAVSMTQYAAQQFTKWLSGVSGVQYRLPTEGEWEYAARGGTDTAYYWGDDPDAAEDHAWYYDNADEGQEDVGQKETNPFGLLDIAGNVAEWTVNQHTEDYSEFAAKAPLNAIDVVKWPETGTNCVVRGGHWQDDVEQLRTATRLASDDEEWKISDPNFPLSPWWFTDDPARGVGFRLFRSVEPLSDELIAKFWEPSAEDVKFDIESRLEGGRGGLGLVDSDLSKAVEEALN